MKGNVSVGHPVDVATGAMHNIYTDITISGRVDLVWERFYSTALKDKTGPLGPGWFSRYFSTLTFADGKYTFIDEYGAEITFDDTQNRLEQGLRIINYGAFTELSWVNNQLQVTRWDVDTGEIWNYLYNFGPDGAISPLHELNDVTGQGLEFAYDDQEKLIGIRQKLEKRTLVIRYSQLDTIEQIEFLSNDKNIRQVLVTYSYDTKGRLVQVTDAHSNSDHFQYDSHEHIIRELGKDGSIFQFKYDKKGRCIRSSGIDSYDEKTLKYLDYAQWTEVTDSLGNVRRFHHNTDGQVDQEINPLGAEHLTQYDGHGRIVGKTDPLGGTTYFNYDEYGNQHKITDALGQVTHIQHNEFHLPVAYINTAGNEWKRSYDLNNRLTFVSDPEGNSYRFSYDHNGNPMDIIDPLGNISHQSFSGLGIFQAATDWQGNVTSYKVDDFGRLEQKTDPLGAITSYIYDALNNITTIRYPDGTSKHFEYDPASNLTRIVDRNGNITKYLYAPCGRMLERIDPLGNKIHFGWGSEPQRLEAVTNSNGEVYHFEYNVVGWIIGEKGFDGRELGFEYDLIGNRVATINGMGERITYTRDILGRLIQQLLPDGTTTNFAYDEAGFLQSAVNVDSAIEFERNLVGRIIREIQNGHIIERAYDKLGNIAFLESSLGHRVDYEFDANGLLAAITKNNTDSIKIERDIRGSETGRLLPGDLRIKQQFNAVGHLLEQELIPASTDDARPRLETAQALIKRSYHYNEAHLTSIQDKILGNTSYVYDPGEHLINTLRDSGASEQFKYDANDNLIEIDHNGKSETLSYGQGDHLLTRNNTVYEHDKQGRLITKREIDKAGEVKESRYVWDALDQLRSFETPDGKIWTYAYDVFGRRVQKTAPNGDRYGFIWDEDVVLHEVVNDNLCVSWVFDPHSFSPLCKFDRDGVYSVITDHLGTPREMIDRFGRLVWQVDYNTFGGIRKQSKSEISCPVRFQGQWWDEESNLYYNRYRYYDPCVGRYISQDLLRLLGSRNLYQYVLNPVLWIDPFGLAACDTNFDTRQEALNAALDRAGIPRDQRPDQTWTVGNNPLRRGRSGYLYSEDRASHGVYRQYETEQGSRVIAEHQRDGRSHFHAGQPKGDSTRTAVDFGWGGDPGTAERYQQVDGSHHLYYE